MTKYADLRTKTYLIDDSSEDEKATENCHKRKT